MSISKSPVQLTLAEGVPLFCLRDTDHKIGRLKLTFSVPLTYGRHALLVMLGEVLAGSSSSCPGPSALFRRLDELYGATLSCYDDAVNASHYFSVDCSFLPDFVAEKGEETPLSGILSLLSEILCRPVTVGGGFDPAVFAREKSSALAELSSLTASPADVANDRVILTATAGDPRHVHLGFEKTMTFLSEMTPEGLYAYFCDTVRPSPLCVTYVGEKEPDEISSMLKASLGELFAVSRPAWECARSYTPEKATHPDTRMTFPCAQAQVRILYRIPRYGTPEERRVAVMLSALLGECVRSKYFVNVREKEHLCYSCSTFIYSPGGMIVGSAGTSEGEAEHALRSMEKQLDAIRRGEISDAEWEAAAVFITDSFRRVYDSTRSEAALLQTIAYYGEDVPMPAEREALYRAIPREAVVSLAGDLARDTALLLLPDGKTSGGGAIGEEEDDDDEG